MDELKPFLQKYRVKTFAKGEIILCEGDIPEVAYVMKSGIAKTYNLTSDGQEKPIAFDVPYEFFPIGWAFGQLHRTQFYHEAFTDCEVYCVPREDLMGFLIDTPGMLRHTFDYFLKRYLNYQMRINALTQSKASEKVINTLHFLSLRYGRDVEKDLVAVQIPLTQQDLANYMGLTRETTGIELKKLEKQGVLTYRHQNYLIYTNKLSQLIDDDYESGRIIGDEKYVIRHPKAKKQKTK